jgi:hypothetical protein
MKAKNIIQYEVVLESSQTVIAVIASVKDDERGGQGLTSESPLHQSARDTALLTHIVLHECFFDFVFHFICDRWQNQATYYYYYWWGGTESLGICSKESIHCCMYGVVQPY